MKKSVIALALMGAFSGAAFAQSNVTLYGILDVNYMWQQQPVLRPGGTATNPNDYTQESFSAINGSHQSGNRLGLRGTEALGNGLNAIFAIEAGFDITTGQSSQGSKTVNTNPATDVNRLFGRQAYAGLSGTWGAVVAGRLAAFSSGTGDFDMFGRVDPFATGFGLASMGSTFISANNIRVDNAIAYQSPLWAGFRFGVGYSTNVSGAEVATPDANVPLTMLAANWTYGPFFATVTYDMLNNQPGKPDQKHLQIGGTWDISTFRLHAAWAQQTNIATLPVTLVGSGTFGQLPPGAQNYDNDAYLLGATWNFMPNAALLASYQASNAKGQQRGGINFDPDYNVWSIGGTYNLSRRTNLYTSYASRNANGTLVDNGFNAKQFAVGVRHLF